MGMIIAVLNQKGGCGKTTTTDTVSDMLARSGYSVLDIELDPQGNLGLLHGCKDDRNCLSRQETHPGIYRRNTLPA